MKAADKNTKPAKKLADIRNKVIDPQGSYTGNPANPLDEPVQDADDL